MMLAWSRFKGCLQFEALEARDAVVAVAWEELLGADEATWGTRTPIVTVRSLAAACSQFLATHRALLRKYEVPMSKQITCAGDAGVRQVHLQTRDYYQVGPYAIPRWQVDECAAIVVRIDDLPALMAEDAHQFLGDNPQPLPGAMAADVFEAFLLTQSNQVELNLLAA